MPFLGVETILRVKVFDPRPSSCSTLASLPDDSSPGPSWNLHISNLRILPTMSIHSIKTNVRIKLQTRKTQVSGCWVLSYRGSITTT